LEKGGQGPKIEETVSKKEKEKEINFNAYSSFPRRAFFCTRRRDPRKQSKSLGTPTRASIQNRDKSRIECRDPPRHYPTLGLGTGEKKKRRRTKELEKEKRPRKILPGRRSKIKKEMVSSVTFKVDGRLCTLLVPVEDFGA
jgi:hypothetical protein